MHPHPHRWGSCKGRTLMRGDAGCCVVRGCTHGCETPPPLGVPELAGGPGTPMGTEGTWWPRECPQGSGDKCHVPVPMQAGSHGCPLFWGGGGGVEYPPPPPQGLTLFAATPALVLGGRRRMVGPSCSFIAQECSRTSAGLINPWGAGGGGGMEERGGSSIPPRGPHWLGTSGRTVALDHRRSS